MFGRNPGSDRTVDHIPLGSTGAELGVWKGDTSAKFLTTVCGQLNMEDLLLETITLIRNLE